VRVVGVQPISVPQSLAYVLNSAGSKSGVDFDYLLQTAQRESSLNPTAKATGSTAVGLFQFLESTWLEVMKQEGPRLGYQSYADAIQETSDGDFVIKDAKLRAEVLKLREDPQVSADLAAAFTRNNGSFLEGRFGRMPSPGELYIAHFLGARGAETLFRAGLANPDQSAPALFPRQSRANPTIFYEDGQPRTVRQVYQALVRKHDAVPAGGADAAFAAQQLAGDPSSPAPLAFGGGAKWPETQPLPSRFGPEDLSFPDLFSNQPGTGITPRVLLTPQEPPAGNGAFFTQLYGQ